MSISSTATAQSLKNTWPHFKFDPGIIGFGQNQSYYLKSHPLSALSFFDILESDQDPTIHFMILSQKTIQDHETVFYHFNVQETALQKGMSDQSLCYYLITPNMENQSFTFYANTKAPLIIDFTTMRGGQYILNSDQFALNNPLPNISEKLAPTIRDLMHKKKNKPKLSEASLDT